MESPGFIAEGNINPSRFVKVGAAAHGLLVAAAATDVSIGITSDFQKAHPITGASDVHAASGDPVSVLMEGSVCKLQCGSGGLSVGSLVVSDSAGKGVIAAASGTALQWVGAIALEAGAEDEFVTVKVVGTFRRFALV